jgi:hypothetical protein
MTKPKSRPKAATRSISRKSAKPTSHRRPAAAFYKRKTGFDTKHARIIAMLRTPTRPLLPSRVPMAHASLVRDKED